MGRFPILAAAVAEHPKDFALMFNWDRAESSISIISFRPTMQSAPMDTEGSVYSRLRVGPSRKFGSPKQVLQ